MTQAMQSYPALIDGEPGAYGVVFPDLDIGAMGKTIDEAKTNANAVLRDYIAEMDRQGWGIPSPSPLETVQAPSGNLVVSISTGPNSRKAASASLD